jgi:hypothetical protein
MIQQPTVEKIYIKESSESCQLMNDCSCPKQSGHLSRPQLGQHVGLLRVQQRLAHVERHRHDAAR